MLIGYVSDEYYAALPGAAVELRGPDGARLVTQSAPSGTVYAPGLPYHACMFPARAGGVVGEA